MVKRRRRRLRCEGGAALVLVLGVVTVVGLMAAHLVLVSEVTAREARVAAERLHLRYVAESGSARAAWMHAVDRSLFPARTLGADPEARVAMDTWEAWLLDGRPHDLDGGCTVRLRDAVAGVTVADMESVRRDVLTGFGADDAERRHVVETWVHRLEDYVDSNDLLRQVDGGMEAPEYQAAGYPTLPRNGPLQFRQEVYWVPGWQAVLSAPPAVVPPPGVKLPQQGKPPFFSSSATVLRERADLSEEELQMVLAARDRWRDEGGDFMELLGAPLAARLGRSFSFTESGIAEIESVAVSADGRIRRRLTVIRDVRLGEASSFVDAKREALSNWERRLE